MKLVQYVIQIPDRKLKHCTITIKEFYDSLYIFCKHFKGVHISDLFSILFLFY